MILSHFKLNPDQAQELEIAFGELRTISKLELKILEKEESTFTIQIKQVELTEMGRIFNQKELVEKASKIFSQIEVYTFKYIPVTYSIDFNHMNIEWINTQMTELGLKNSDISRQTGIDKATLSLLFTGRKNLNLIHKAMFYFYFENYRICRKCRDGDSI
jgi:hypothetical protein